MKLDIDRNEAHWLMYAVAMAAATEKHEPQRQLYVSLINKINAEADAEAARVDAEYGESDHAPNE